jgi:hypothetical protein
MITRFYDTFLYAENPLEDQTANKSDTIDFCSFRLQKGNSENRGNYVRTTHLFSFGVCTVKIPDWRLATLDKNT